MYYQHNNNLNRILNNINRLNMTIARGSSPTPGVQLVESYSIYNEMKNIESIVLS